MFSGYFCFFLGEIHPSEVQQHNRIPMVGLRSWMVVHSLLNTYGSSLDAVQSAHYSWYPARGKLYHIRSEWKKKSFESSFIKTIVLLSQRFSILCTPTEDIPLTKSEKNALELLSLPSSQSNMDWWGDLAQEDKRYFKSDRPISYSPSLITIVLNHKTALHILFKTVIFRS